MSDQNKTRSQRFFTTAIAVLAVGAFGPMACSRTDQNQQAIEEARSALARVAVAGSSSFTAGPQRVAVYQLVLKKLQGVDDTTADAGQRSAKAILSARAQGGLAEVSAQNAANLEAQFLNDVSVANAVLDQWNGQNAVADALQSYDPAADLAAIDRDVAARMHDAKLASDKEIELEFQVKALKAKAENCLSSAKGIRDEQVAVRAKFDSMTQTARAAALEASAARLREADQFDKAASLYQADAAKLQPRVDEQKAEVARIRRQAELLRGNREDIQKHYEANMSQATAARGEAATAGQQLDKLLTELATSRAAVENATKDAAKAYTAAVGLAKKAKMDAAREGQAPAVVTAGAFEQARGDLLANRARSLATFSHLMTGVAGAKPPLPGAAGYKPKAEAIAKESTEAADEAAAAYKSAKDIFMSVSGGSDEAKARMKTITDSLGKLAHEAPEAPKAEGEPAAPPAQEPAAAPAAPAAPGKDAKPAPEKAPAPAPKP